MPPRKTPSPQGILPQLKRFWRALGDRYQRVLQVIDEALISDNLKDKIWAVDLILKRSSVTEAEPQAVSTARRKKKIKPPSPQELAALSETELLTRIRDHLKDWAGE